MRTIARRLFASRHGASLVENGMLVGLIAIVATAAVSVLGVKVENQFCRAAHALGADLACTDTAGNVATGPGNENSGFGEDVRADEIAAQFDDDYLEDGATTQVGFKVAGLSDGMAFHYAITDSAGTTLAEADDNRSSAPTSPMTIDLASAAPGLLILTVTATAPDGSPLSAQDTTILYRLGSFTDTLGQVPGATGLLSNAITIEGIQGSLTAHVGTGILVVNGIAGTSTATIHDGDAIALRADAPAGANATLNVPLTVGPLSRNWTIGTGAATLPAENPLEVAFVTDIVDIDTYSGPLFQVSGLSDGAAFDWTLAADGGLTFRNGSGTVSGSTGVSVSGLASAPTGQVVLGASGSFHDGSPSAATLKDATFVSAGSFTPVTEGEPADVIISDGIVILGLSTPTTVSASGGTLLVNGEASGMSADVTSDDILSLRVTAGSYEQTVTARLALGPLTRDFAATSRKEAVTPAELGFIPVTDAVPGSSVFSNIVGLTGFTGSKAFAVTGATFQKNKTGGWLSSGTVSAGDTVQLSAVAPATADTRLDVTATVDGLTKPWSVTTASGAITPQAFVFPATTGVDPGAWGYSKLARIKSTAPVLITGDASFQLRSSSNGYNWQTGAVVVRNNGYVSLRATASPTLLDTLTKTVTAGGYSTDWSIATRAPKTKANVFSFTTQTNLPLAQSVDSNVITVAGLEAAAPISVSNGAWRIVDSEGEGSFTTAAGNAPVGAMIQVRGTSSSDFHASSQVSLDIGGRVGTFTMLTRYGDSKPDPLAIPGVSDLAWGADAVSATLVPVGYESPARVTLGGDSAAQAKFRIDGGNWTTEAYISPGQSIQLQAKAAPTGSTKRSISLFMGGSASYWQLKTMAGSMLPADIDLTTVTDVDPSSLYYGDAITVVGLTGTTVISATGGGKVQRLDNGIWTDVSGTTPIANGDIVRLGVQSAASFSASVTATFTFGPAGNRVTRTWTIVTSDGMSPADAMEFDPVTDAPLATSGNTVYIYSNPVVISGLNGAAKTAGDTSASSLYYSVNGGTFKSNASFNNQNKVVNGDTVVLRIQMSSTVNASTVGATTTATFKVGSSSHTWTVTADSGQDAASIALPDRSFDYYPGVGYKDLRTAPAIVGASNVLAIGPLEVLSGSSDTTYMGFDFNSGTTYSRTLKYVTDPLNTKVKVQISIPNYGETRIYRLMVGSTPATFSATTAAYKVPTFTIPAVSGAHTGGTCNATNANTGTSGQRIGPFTIDNNGPVSLGATASGTGITTYVDGPGLSSFSTSESYNSYTEKQFYVWVCANAASRTGMVTVTATPSGSASGQQSYSTSFSVTGN